MIDILKKNVSDLQSQLHDAQVRIRELNEISTLSVKIVEQHNVCISTKDEINIIPEQIKLNALIDQLSNLV